MKKLFLLMAAICCLAGAWAQYLETPQILETNTTQYMAPSVLNWKYSITQQIYTAAELDMPQCDIHGISFYHNNTYTGGMPRHVKIYLGTTTKRNFADSTFVGLTSSMKLVYTGDIVADPVAGWVPIEFDTDFEYSGVSNLVLCVVDTTGSYSTNNNASYGTNTSTGIHAIKRYSDTEALTLNSDGTVTGTGGSSTYTALRSVVKFFYGYQPYNSDQLMEWDKKDMFPFTSAWKYSRSQQIFEQNELCINPQYILDLSLLQATAGGAARKLKIWMANTTKTTYSSISDGISTDEMTLVYDGTLQTNTEAGWLDIKLQTPFFYEGNNLMIAFADSTGTTPARAIRPYFAVDGRQLNHALYSFTDTLSVGYSRRYGTRSVLRINSTIQVGDTVPYRAAGNTLYYKLGSIATLVAPTPTAVNNCRWGDYEQPSGIVYVPDTIVVGHFRKAVKCVGSCALMGLQNITEVRLPDAVSRIDAYGFANSSVRIVNIPTGLSSMGNASFQNCQQLDSLTIAEGTTWGDAWDTWKNCKALTDVENGYMRFHSGFGIRYNGVIGDTLLNVPSYIHTLGCYCYYYAAANATVTEVMLSENMQQILNYPFFRMININRINVQATTPPTVTDKSFWTYDSQSNSLWRDLTQQAVLYVPYSDDHSVIAAYRAHSVWGTFTDIRESPRYNVSLAFAHTDDADHAMLLLDWRTDILQKQVAEHSDVALFVIPFEHYHFVGWGDGNTENPRTVRIGANTDFFANIAPDPVIVTAHGGLHGAVTGGGTYGWGENVTLTAEPVTGYEFIGWSDGNTDNPRTFVATQDTMFTANWQIRRFTVTLTPAEHGIIYTGGTFDYGTYVPLVAEADEHYRFDRWSDGSTENPHTIFLDRDTTFSAVFLPLDYTISAGQAMTGGAVTGYGTYAYGTQAVLTAVPDEHYRFELWSDGSTDNPRTITVGGDLTLSASFLPMDYTISAAQAIVGGEVTGYGTYPYATEVVLTAVPAEGYIFKQWSDGPTENPRTVVMTDNYLLDPVFEQLSGLESTAAEKARKVMIDGQVYILRGGKTYNIFGTEM